MKKIGLDIHGVIDKYPLLFKKLTNYWVNDLNCEVHIITDQERIISEPYILSRSDYFYSFSLYS